jgi:hypothetical protein
MISLANVGMEYGVAVLLDALGTKRNYEREPIDEIRARWTVIDSFLEDSVHILARELENHGFRNDVLIQRPYDNLQIFLPVDHFPEQGSAIDFTGTNPIWWTIVQLGELLIPLFRIALINKIFLRGCICQGRFFRVGTRIFGFPVDEAAENYEVTDWIGIIAAYSANLVLNVGLPSQMASIFNFFLEYNVPTKDNSIKRLSVLNWTRNRQNMYSSRLIGHEHILNVMKKELCNAQNKSIAKKWQNTLNFYNQYHSG